MKVGVLNFPQSAMLDPSAVRVLMSWPLLRSVPGMISLEASITDCCKPPELVKIDDASSPASCLASAGAVAAFDAPLAASVATHEPDAIAGCEGRRHPTLPAVSLLCWPTAFAVVVSKARTRVWGPCPADADTVPAVRTVASATSSSSGERRSRRRVLTGSSLAGGCDTVESLLASSGLLAFETTAFGSLEPGDGGRRRGRVGGWWVAGELVLEVGDVLLEADDLCPEAVAFGGELDDAFGELGGRVLPAQGVASFAFGGAVGAHPFGVGGPFAWSSGTGLVIHADHFRTCVYCSTVSHTCTSGSCTSRPCPWVPVSWASAWSSVLF